MSRFIGALVAFAVCVFTLGCEQSNRVFSNPTSPSGGTSAPAPAPTPTPPPLAPVEFTEITVGQTVTAIVPTPAPLCLGDPWPCQYFRFTAPSDGRLTVELRYRPETQPPGRFGLQGVDISVTDAASGRGVWADFWSPEVTRAKLDVKEGVIYQITLWYTYPDLAYELQTTLER
jgi:hypothetical protein